MSAPRAILNRLRAASPWMTLAMLLGLSMALPNRSGFDPQAELRKASVAQAMKAAPFFIGRWVGEDASHQVPKEAQTLLHPNAILSRTYRSPAGPSVQVLVVHCGDARDMIGHYPPICYPSTGWLLSHVDEPNSVEVSVNGRSLQMRRYVFHCVGPRGTTETIRVLNAFVLPNGQVAMDIDDIHRQSERLALSIQGVAQLQVITSAALPLPDAVQAASEILSGMSGVFDALEFGQGASRAT